MSGSRSHARVVLAALCSLVAGCEERLTGGAACPSLCPEQSVVVRDTVIFPVDLDSTLLGYPPLGAEPALLVTTRGDSLRTGGVFRFDTLTRDLVPRGGVARTVAVVDSAALVVQVAARAVSDGPVTMLVYDVNSAAADYDTAAVRALFAGAPIAERTFPRDSVVADTGIKTLAIPLPRTFVEPRVLAGQRIRLGLAVQGQSSVQLRVPSQQGSGTNQLRYYARTNLDTPAERDTSTIIMTPQSRTPETDALGRGELADYTVVLVGAAVAAPDVMAVGGVPAGRAYLRFVLPSSIVDSTTIIRATVLLTQRPNSTAAAADSVTIEPRAVVATALVEPGKAALLLADPGFQGTTAVTIVPRDSGERRFEIVNLVERYWKASDAARFQRSLVLRSTSEGIAPQQIFFFSREAASDALRPRLRLSYIPRAGLGLP